MKNKIRILILVLILPISMIGQNSVEIVWSDLIPEGNEFEDPFEDLTESQMYDLSLVARIRSLEQNNPASITEKTLAELNKIEKSLMEQGVDVEGLLSQRDQISELRRKAYESINPTLNGVKAKMPGYLLPLEYSGKEVTELLLVPWVGACSHTPPPPKNQIVYIKIKEGYQVRSRFEAVWVEGTMITENRTQELYLVDGKSDIHTGYSIDALKIESYKTK